MNRRHSILFLAGLLFGFGLAVSGMTDPGRVIGFLDVAGKWDPSLAFVMGGAVVTVGVGLLVLRPLTGGKGWFGTMLPVRDTGPIDRRLVVGALVFGVGWGLGGFCPGPAVASLAAGRTAAFVFVPAMAVGMGLARALAKTDSP
jgi:uncharacterized membrane protein YedE/YeeE